MNLDNDEVRALLTRPVAFHRLFATIAGSLGGGVFLSQLYYWSERSTNPEGWIYKTAEEWFEETMLSRHELPPIRKALREKGIITEKLAGVPATVHYKIESERLFSALKKAAKEQAEAAKKRRAPQFAEKRQTGFPKSGKLDGSKPGSQFAEKRQTRLMENGKLDGRKAENKSTGNRQTTLLGQRLSETTTEKTTTTLRVHAPAKERGLLREKDVVVVSHCRVEEEEELLALNAKERKAIEMVDRLAAKFSLSAEARGVVLYWLNEKDLDYVEAKAALTESQPRDNPAGFFLSALEKNWQPARSSRPCFKKRKSVPAADEPPGWFQAQKELYPDALHYTVWANVPRQLKAEILAHLAKKEDRKAA